MWVPAHLADIESDMSAVHGVRDIDELSAPKFFGFAWRLPHYRGVMRDRVIALQREQDEDVPVITGGRDAPRAVAAPPESRQPVTKAVLADPLMARIFDFD